MTRLRQYRGVQKENGMKKSIRYVVTIIALAAGIVLFSNEAGQALAATVTVTNEGCRIRSDASTSSDPVSSVDKGKKLDVVGEVTASDGYTWYKVKVEGDKTGYIRADLVSTPDGDSSSSDSSSTKTETKSETKTETKSETKSEAKTETKTETKASEPVPAPEVVETDAVTATVSADTVTVRSSASTKSDKKASASSGQEVSISGEATDSDGKTWYQVSFEADGKTIDGFIRSDFLNVTSTKADLEPEEPVEEEPVEEVPEATPAVNNDYEVKYEANSEGIEEWFLYDHINGTKQSINNIHAVMEQSLNPVVDDRSEVKTMKIIIIVMAVIMLLLIAGIAVLLFRLRDNYEDFGDIDDGYDEEEEEEEIEEMDEEPEYRGRRSAPVREKRFGRKSRAGNERDYEDEDDGYEEEEEEAEEYRAPVRRSRTPERTERRVSSRRDDEAWSSRSLSDIDDDMEFEFLDLDN